MYNDAYSFTRWPRYCYENEDKFSVILFVWKFTRHVSFDRKLS